jgi:DNA-binding CsgD family transcriptional regulator/transposase-like protein
MNNAPVKTMIAPAKRKYNLNKQSIIEQNKQAIIQEYLSRKTNISQMASKYSVEQCSIHNALRRWGVPKRERVAKPKTRILNENKDLIIKLYTQDKLTGAQIAKKLKLAECTIQLKLKEWGIPARSYQKITPQQAKEMVEKGYNTKEIADMYNTDSGTVSKVLRTKLGIQLTKRVLLSSEEKKLINKLYTLKGESVPAIANKLQELRIKNKNPQKPAEEITPAVIYNRIKEWKLQKKQITLDEAKQKEQAIVDSFALGKYITTISNEYKVPKKYIYQILNKYWAPKINKQTMITKERAERARELRSKGISVEEISLRTRITPAVLQEILQKATIHHNKAYTKEELDQLAQKIKILRTTTKDTKETIAKKTNISTTLVGRIIKEYNIPKTNKVFDNETNNKILELYNKGIHYDQIAKQLNLKQESVRQQLTRIGVQRRTSPWSKKYSYDAIAKQNELIKKLYGPKYRASITQIAKALRLDKTTIRARMKKMGIKINSAQEIRELKKKKLNPKKAFVIKKKDRQIMERKI